MTVVIDLTTDIDAPTERVFHLARDLDFHMRSMAHTGEQAVGGRTTGRVEAGEVVMWRARHFWLWWSMTSRITVVEPPTRFEDIQERGPFAWFHHQHRFEPLAGGGTRMGDHWEHRSPFGPLGWLADQLVLRPLHGSSARDPERGPQGRGGVRSAVSRRLACDRFGSNALTAPPRTRFVDW